VRGDACLGAELCVTCVLLLFWLCYMRYAGGAGGCRDHAGLVSAWLVRVDAGLVRAVTCVRSVYAMQVALEAAGRYTDD